MNYNSLMKMRRIRHQRKKWILIAFAVLLAIGLGFAIYSYLGGQKTTSEDVQEITTSENEENGLEPGTEDKTIHLAMMGDMLAHDSVNYQAKTADGYDYKQYFASIKSLYSDADIVFCNPEIPVAGDEYGVSGYPTFNAPSAFARDLVEGAGCNVVNLASNHQNDKGQSGINASLEVWKGQNLLAMSGMNSSTEEQNKISYFTIKDVKFAFLAFADFSNAKLANSYSVNSYHNTELVQRLMAEANASAQVVLVSMHWGTEDSNTVNADQKKMAQLLADSGATIIIGTGPHVEQPAAWLKSSDERDVLVWYSIGNMLSSQLGINGLTSGVAACDIQIVDGNVKVNNLSFSPTFMSYEWSVADKAASNISARRNLKLRPLSEAESDIKAMFGDSYSVAERRSYLEKTLDAANAGITLK